MYLGVVGLGLGVISGMSWAMLGGKVKVTVRGGAGFEMLMVGLMMPPPPKPRVGVMGRVGKPGRAGKRAYWKARGKTRRGRIY